MDVIQIFTEFKSKSEKDIITIIKKDLKSNNKDYIKNSKNEWEGLNTKIQALYSETGLLGALNSKKIQYFLFNTNSNNSKKKVSLDLLILSENENINFSINEVIKDLNRILKNSKIKVIKSNHVFLFPYNNSERDIYDQEQKIKAEFKSILPSMHEIIRIIIFMLIFVITIVLAIGGEFSEFEKTYPIIEILWSIAISSGIFLISEVIIKIIPTWNLNVSITNLSDCIRHNHTTPYGTNDEAEELKNPEVEE